MYEINDNLVSCLFIGVGAVFGSWVRMHMIDYFRFKGFSRYFGTFIVNTAAVLFLGIFAANHNDHFINTSYKENPLLLFVSVGFLGSLSTFSTFVRDLLKLILEKKFKFCSCLAIFSILSGLLFALLGLSFGDA